MNPIVKQLGPYEDLPRDATGRAIFSNEAQAAQLMIRPQPPGATCMPRQR
jgi:hypothetical protein